MESCYKNISKICNVPFIFENFQKNQKRKKKSTNLKDTVLSYYHVHMY